MYIILHDPIFPGGVHLYSWEDVLEFGSPNAIHPYDWGSRSQTDRIWSYVPVRILAPWRHPNA